LNRYLKKALKVFGILLGLLLILYLIVFAYVSANKKSIISQVTNDLSKKLNGTVTVGEVELSFLRSFPRASVVLRNVSITDTMYAQHHHAFFTARQVFAQLSIIKLLKKQSAVNGFKVERGSVYLYTDTSGYTNTYLFRQKKDTSSANDVSAENNELKSIILKDVRIIIDDRKKQKLHDIVVNNLNIKLDDKNITSYIFSTKADMMVHSLAFNLPAGSFIGEKKFEGNFDLKYDKKLKRLQFDGIDIKLSDHPFNLSGWFDLAGPDPQFSLNLHTRQILFPFVKSLVTKKIATALSIVDLDKKVDADAIIRGPLKGGDPFINVKWNVKDTHLTTPFFDFENASLDGFYTDEVVAGLPRRDPNSRITISNFSASWHGLPVTSKNIEILNLYQPLLTCDLQSDLPLTKLNALIGSNVIQLKSGDGSINLTYKGPIFKNNNTNSFVNGVVSFKNGTVFYAPRDVELKNVNGSMSFKNSDVFIENLQCVVLNNKIVMDGHAKNLLTLINTAPNEVNIDWNIYSPSLNFTAFNYLLKPKKKTVHSNTTKGNLRDVAKKIDAVLEEGKLHVNLKAARLIYKKLEATDAVADVLLLQDRYVINKVSMQHSGGRVDLSGSLITQASNTHQANVNAFLYNVDVNKVFASFNNFGQDGITSQNLDGKLTADISASLIIDQDGKAYPNSIKSIVDFSLKDGTLTNFEPVKKLQNFLFKNRDFENIHFAELKDKLEIANQEIKINRMEIQSNVLTMYVEGVYSMKGNTDMSIQVPLSNLKKRGADYKPENTGTDKKVGTSLFIRGRPGADGSIQFKSDIFNKFKKQKEKKLENNQ